MSDDDRDNDLESDMEVSEIFKKNCRLVHSKRRKHSSEQIYRIRKGPKADKRAHHNALERKRRDHIKDSFSSLRDSLPCMAGEKASRAQVLKKAADYIQQMRRKNSAHQQDIEDLKRQNKILEEQIRNLEKAKATGNYAANAVLEASHYNTKGDAISAFDGGSGSESSDTDGSKDDRRKKLKTSLIDAPLRA